MTRPQAAVGRLLEPHFASTRMVSCACGGRYRVDRREPVAAIRNHQRTKLHQAWRARTEAA